MAAAVPVIPGGAGIAIRAITGVEKVVDSTKGVRRVVEKTDDVVDAVKQPAKTYQTYTKTNPVTKNVYAGKTSGKGTPQQNIARRDRGHQKNKDGFGPAKLDKSSKNPNAIRGREQELIDKNRSDGRSGNIRNSVSPRNQNREKYRRAAEKEFGKSQ